MPTPIFRTRDPRAGFSAIELMTILVVVGILLSLAAPSMGEYIDRTYTRRGLDQVVADVSFARMAAVEQGTRAAVRFQTNGIYTVETRNLDGTWKVVRTVRLQGDYPGVAFGAPGTALEFSSRGLITNLSTEAHLKLVRGDVRDSAFVSPAGRVYRDF
jgi:Tfp pilus assembly protein FimT